MKKLVCLGLAALLAVQTTACGVNAQESTAKNEELVVEDVGVTEDKLPERNLKDDRLEQVTESGKLLIGISPDYAPFAFKIAAIIFSVTFLSTLALLYESLTFLNSSMKSTI